MTYAVPVLDTGSSHWTMQLDLQPDVLHRIDLHTPIADVPVLYRHRPEHRSALVFCNGAVDQNVSGGQPVFQRSSWSDEVAASQVFVCDPITTGREGLTLGWGQVSQEEWIVPALGPALIDLASALGGTTPLRRRYFGSSAGGFLALALSVTDPGSRAILNNAQFDWTRWMPMGLNPLRERLFKNAWPLHLRRDFPTRTNVLTYAVEQNVQLSIDYWVNTASLHDREIDYPMLHRFTIDHPELLSDVTIHCYGDDVSGHNPLPKDRTLAILNI